jgi:hypothetical protein
MAELTAPIKTDCIATLVDVSDVIERTRDGKKRYFRMLNFAVKNSDDLNLAVNEKFFQSNLSRFKEDNVLKLTYENVIEGKTFWEDDKKKQTTHSYTGTSIVKVLKASSRDIKLLYRNEDLEWAKEQMLAVDVQSQLAMATLLANR